MSIVKASSSLPFVTKISYVDGIPMLDGGIVDSIPVKYALEQGYDIASALQILSEVPHEGQ